MVEITRIGSEFQVTATVKDILDVEIYRELRKEIVQAFKEKILAERAQEVMALYGETLEQYKKEFSHA